MICPTIYGTKSDGETLVMTAAYDTTIKNLTSNLTGDDPVVSALDTQNFNLEKNQLVVLGSMTLDIDTPDSGSFALSGQYFLRCGIDSRLYPE